MGFFYGRGKNKVQNPLTLIDTYKAYISELKEDDYYYVDYKTYRKICSLFYKMIMDYILLKAGKFDMPYNLGSIRVLKKKTPVYDKRSLTLDYNLTNIHNKPVYQLNEHTSGYKYMFYWDKTYGRLANKHIYRFILTRTNKRRLAKLIKSGDYDYFEKY